MNEPPLLLHAEMYIDLHALTGATVLVLFVNANIMLAAKVQSTSNKLAGSNNDHSLALADGFGKCLPNFKTRAQIDGYETKYPLNAKPYKKLFGRNQLVSLQSWLRVRRGRQSRGVILEQNDKDKNTSRPDLSLINHNNDHSEIKNNNLINILIPGNNETKLQIDSQEFNHVTRDVLKNILKLKENPQARSSNRQIGRKEYQRTHIPKIDSLGRYGIIKMSSGLDRVHHVQKFGKTIQSPQLFDHSQRSKDSDKAPERHTPVASYLQRGENSKDFHNTPGADIPGKDTSGADTRDTDIPRKHTYRTDIPGRDTSETDIPGKDTPDEDILRKDTFETDIPGKDTRGVNIPNIDTLDGGIAGKDTRDADIPRKDTYSSGIPVKDTSDINISGKDIQDADIFSRGTSETGIRGIDTSETDLSVKDIPDVDTYGMDTPDADIHGKDTRDTDTPGKDTSDGDTSGKDTSDGETPGKDTSDGETHSKNTSDDETHGKDTSDGDTPDKDTSDGNTPGKDTSDGGTPSKDTSDGDTPDATFGQPIDGKSRLRRQVSTGTPLAPNNRNIRAREEGDAIIGGLFPLHHAPTQRTAYTRTCGEIREYYGIQRVETFIRTIEAINRDPSILPHIKLGWDIRDSCWYSAIALENSIDFIKDAIASQARNSNIVSSSSAQDMSSSLTSTGQQTSKVCVDNKNLKPIIGLVGPGSSESSIQVQNLLQIFNLPQIGYSATSMDLSDKSHYKYFLRVVPPDRYQAQALVDILVRFNWTYISTVHSDGNYGVRGMEKFTDLAKAKGVCIAVSDNVASTAEESAFDSVLDNLLEAPNASVVVCFCEGITVLNIFKATRRRNMEGRFLVIGSDGWGNRLDVVEGVETAAAGGISIKLYSPPLSDFAPYYDKLKPSPSSKNPWLNEFWEWKFKCSLDRRELRGHTRVCVGNESLAGSLEDSKLGFVVNAVTTLARALHNMHGVMCPGSKGLCPAMEPLNGSVYLQYLLNVSFQSYSGEAVHFDSQGDPPGRYEILNYQPIKTLDGNTTYDYVTVGHWMTGSLTLNGHEIYWPRGQNNGRHDHLEPVRSLCSDPCKRGQAKKVRGVACCWICTTCLQNEILVDNNTDCRSCDLGKWPNVNKTDCEDIPIDFIDWADTQAIVCITLACLGICVTVWVFAIFARYHDTPVVKASTRELSYIILVGICMAFSANLFIVAKPSRAFCYLTRILPGLSFSLIYGALVTRTNRIARILEGSKRIMTKKPRFMSATAQVVITGLIIGIECAVIAGMLVYQPADSALDYPAPRKVRLVCDTSTPGIVVPLTFDLVLIILCTLYAVKTRNLPENFNEAKFIGFTMYSTCVIWLGFFPIYFAGDNKEITLSLCVSLSAAIALLLLFVPKVYVIVWVPEKNTRGAFTTSKDVRCHIGSKSMASGDSIDIKESSTFDSLFKSDRGQSKYWRQKSLDEKRLRFVMQRAGASDGETPYINHGVLPNHSKLRSAFVDRDSKDSSRTDTTPVSSLSCPDKERLFPVEPREVTNAEMIRQNLARDYPMSKRQVILRPGSPAEKEKHRVHSVDRPIDLDMLLGVKMLHCQRNCRKHGDFRKSLSSTCVSIYSKTRNVQCQTTDDLVANLLPPLRKRCVAKTKNRLERSGAVDDSAACPASISKDVCVVKYPSPYRTSLSIQRFNAIPPKDVPHRPSPSNLATISPPIVFHSCNPQDFYSSSESDIEESPYMLHVRNEDHIQRRHSHNVFRSDCYQQHHETRRRRSNDPSSILLSVTNASSLQTFKPRLVPPDTSDFSFMEGVESMENAISPLCKLRSDNFSRRLSKDLPEDGRSPSNRSASYPTWCHNSNDVSSSSLTHQESCGSTSISATSSSFTLPPFPDSVDSNASEEIFGDSDHNFDLGDSNSNAERNESDEIFEHGHTSLGRESNTGADNTLKANNSRCEVPVVSPVNRDQSEDIAEFQRYLQEYGVRIDLSKVQSSDL